jgi:hypothetical protein
MPDADPPLGATQSSVARFAFGELTPAQIDSAANVAFGGRGVGCHPRNLQSLAKRHLIVASKQEDRTRGVPFRWTEWSMPIDVHVAFCARALGAFGLRQGDPFLTQMRRHARLCAGHLRVSGATRR